jgi:hypothetical protein
MRFKEWIVCICIEFWRPPYTHCYSCFFLVCRREKKNIFPVPRYSFRSVMASENKFLSCIFVGGFCVFHVLCYEALKMFLKSWPWARQQLRQLNHVGSLHMPGIYSVLSPTVQLTLSVKRAPKCRPPVLKEASDLLRIFLDTSWNISTFFSHFI